MKVWGQRIWALAGIPAYLATVTVNGLANALPLNGRTTGEISDSYPNLFVPAGITFSIWGVIYLLLAMFVTAAAILAFSSGSKPALPPLAMPVFVVSSAANIAWIFAWHWDRVLLSFVFMLTLLTCLCILCVSLNKDQAPGLSDPQSTAGRVFFRIPVSVYLGWISVATIANLTAILVRFNWNGFGLSPVFWTFVTLAEAATLGVAMLLIHQDAAYTLVISWAFLGIYLARRTGTLQAEKSIAATAWILAAVLTLLCVVIPVLKMRQLKKAGRSGFKENA